MMFFRDFLEEIEGDSSRRLCTVRKYSNIVASSFFTSVGAPDKQGQHKPKPVVLLKAIWLALAKSS